LERAGHDDQVLLAVALLVVGDELQAGHQRVAE
jgi:hypothetical protein